MFGMGGQLAICFPEKDLLLVTTADTQDDRRGDGIILDLFFKTIFANLSGIPLAENPEKQRELAERLARCAIKPLKGIDQAEAKTGFAGHFWAAAGLVSTSLLKTPWGCAA